MRHLMMGSGGEFFRELERLDLSLSQIKSLQLLDLQDAASIKALSDQLGLSLPAVSRAVEALVKRGMVTRAEDPEDRRAKHLTITAKGRRTTRRLIELRVASIRDFVDGLHDYEREALAAGLRPLMERPEIGALTPRR
jgi:DNA-binding MarR family transcriptional regulator